MMKTDASWLDERQCSTWLKRWSSLSPEHWEQPPPSAMLPRLTWFLAFAAALLQIANATKVRILTEPRNWLFLYVLLYTMYMTWRPCHDFLKASTRLPDAFSFLSFYLDLFCVILLTVQSKIFNLREISSHNKNVHISKLLSVSIIVRLHVYDTASRVSYASYFGVVILFYHSLFKSLSKLFV